MKTHCSALETAEVILEWHDRNGCGISNIRLNFLLYFVQAWYLMKSNGKEACFPEAIEARSYGPIVSEVYDRYKGNGSLDIMFGRKDKADIGRKDRQMIEDVVEHFRNHSLLELHDLVLHQRPWINAFHPHCTMKISNEAIADYFMAG